MVMMVVCCVGRHLKKGGCPGLKIYDQSELPVAGLEQTILGEGELVLGGCPCPFGAVLWIQ